MAVLSLTERTFAARTLDDAMHKVLRSILDHGDPVVASRGENAELRGVTIELESPRARLSNTETRGKAFSPLGELCWYLAKGNQLDFVRYYIDAYAKSADDGVIYGGYGPRLFSWDGQNQIADVIALLRRKPSSRRSVVQL